MPSTAIALLLFICLFALSSQGQEPRTNQIVSPEVHPDRTATFRVSAPKATTVTFLGDWMPPGKEAPMTRDANGIWSITQGPLDSGLSIYHFTIDGVTTPDPVNPRVKLRARTSASLVDIPGNVPQPWEAQNVPHGDIHIKWSHSKATGDSRAYYVYTPPGYNPVRNTRYPLLVLLHGNNDTAAGWTDVGKANFIMDNLLAQRAAKPMIIVMPWGHALPYGSPGDKNTSALRSYLLDEIVPSIEKEFRVAAGRRNRAIVGLSMGGGHALEIGLDGLDTFSAVGVFSGAVPRSFEDRFKTLLQDPSRTNSKLDLFWIGCGKDDFLIERNRELDQLLTRHGIKHTYRETDGRHNYAVWRRYLSEVLPLLFQGGQKR